MYFLWRLLEIFFIKRTLNFLTVIISYFICHWNCQLNFLYFKFLFRPFFSLLFEHCHQKKILESRSYHQILNIISPYFIFIFLTTCFLRSHFYRWRNCIIVLIDKYVMYINILSCIMCREILKKNSWIVLLNLSITQDFSSFSVE